MSRHFGADTKKMTGDQFIYNFGLVKYSLPRVDNVFNVEECATIVYYTESVEKKL